MFGNSYGQGIQFVSYSIALTETTRGLYATWRMFIRDARAADLFENSYAGAVRSYWAALVVLPIYLLSVAMESSFPSKDYFNFATLAEHSGLLAASLAEFCVFTLAFFVAWPLVMDKLAGYLDCEKNFFRYIAAYNWMHVPYALIGLVFWIGKLSGFVHDGNGLIVSLSLLGLLWTYHWFILRHALGLNGGFAAMLVGAEYFMVLMLKDVIVTTAL